MGRPRIPAAIRRSLPASVGYRCHYCHELGDADHDPQGRTWHFDHMTPLAAGGTNTADNIVLACSRCNTAKSDAPYDVYMAHWNQRRAYPIAAADPADLLALLDPSGLDNLLSADGEP